ncbi:hypothetical protein CGRA01v4_09177 [Colletotrichum graminicola]|nr:hypothetical protein CGRA01v4_09177 [Colletotrichum graminicola]
MELLAHHLTKVRTQPATLAVTLGEVGMTCRLASSASWTMVMTSLPASFSRSASSPHVGRRKCKGYHDKRRLESAEMRTIRQTAEASLCQSVARDNKSDTALRKR